MGKLRALVALGLAAIAVVTTASCLDPTQVTLHVSTDAPCADTKGTYFIGGGARLNERTSPSATSSRCIGGDLGTLVATPSDSKDTDAWFVVVTGIDRPARECTAENKYKGCIVQRRAVRYAKHEPISLPIRMWLVCKDVECDAESTCARNGKCVPARIVDPEACASNGCFPEGDPDPERDSGTVDTGTEPGAESGAEGGPGTDSGMNDASADGADSSVAPTRLYCPPVANGCDPGGTCCWSRSGLLGTCTEACGELPMKCSRKSDCGGTNECCGKVLLSASDDGGPPIRTLSNATCAVEMAGLPCGTAICVQTSDCPAGKTCDKTSTLFTPTGYFGECVPAP